MRFCQGCGRGSVLYWRRLVAMHNASEEMRYFVKPVKFDDLVVQ
jgi:hypothetical protein